MWKCYLHRVSKPISVGESEVTNPGLGKRTTSFWWRSDSSMGRDLCNISHKEYKKFFWVILQNFVKFKSSYLFLPIVFSFKLVSKLHICSMIYNKTMKENYPSQGFGPIFTHNRNLYPNIRQISPIKVSKMVHRLFSMKNIYQLH